MNLNDIRLMFDYNYWANTLMLSKAVEVTAEQYTQPTGFPWGNLRGTLIHTMDSEHLWRNLLQHGQILPRYGAEHFPTLDSLAAFWKSEEQAMRDYLNSLTDGDMDSIIRYEADGNKRERVLWHCLWHMVNHGMQHRSEIAQMLTMFGYSPDSIDFTYYMNLRTKQV